MSRFVIKPWHLVPALAWISANPQGANPGLLEPVAAYRDMGLLAFGSPIAFVGAVRFFAGPSPDSTLVLLSLSLGNGALSFRRAGPLFQAAYRVDAAFRSGASRREIHSDQVVRVPTLADTRRTDESVIFQQFVLVPPGDGSVDVVVLDQSTGESRHDERTVRVPRFGGSAVSSIVPVYRSAGRTGRGSRPDLLANPRATVPVASDTLAFYVEAYGATSDSAVMLRALDEAGAEVWRSVTAMQGDFALRVALVRIPPGTLIPGRLLIEAVMRGATDTTRTPVLAGYTDQWVVATFEGVLDLLRYFEPAEAIHQLQASPDSARASRWRRFWKDTDPDPATPENESLVRYFSRLQTANTRFREGTQPGWLTDRGEVFLVLGEPDEEFDLDRDTPGQRRVDLTTCVVSCPGIGWRWWSHAGKPLVLIFVYDSKLGRYRLDPSSRREFQLAVARNP